MRQSNRLKLWIKGEKYRALGLGSKVQGIRIHGIPVHGINDTPADIAIMRDKLFKEVANVRKRNFRPADKILYTYNLLALMANGLGNHIWR